MSPAPRPKPKSAPQFGTTLEFLRLLWALEHGLQTRSKRMFATLGVTGPQRMVIRVVGVRGEVSAGEIARLLHTHPSTLTGVLDRLVRARTLSRRADPVDARRALFRLTAAGRRIDRTRSGTIEAAVERVLRRLPQARIAAARAVLEALVSELRDS